MIKLEGIEKVYRTEQVETVALSNINFAVDEGEFISVMGPSGSGKSTLLNVIGTARRAFRWRPEPERGGTSIPTPTATWRASATRRSASSSRAST